MKDEGLYNNNLITEEQVNKVSKILHLGNLTHVFNSIVIMKCPFNHKCKNEFMVNLHTGKYHCRHCGREGDFHNLALDLSLCFTPAPAIEEKFQAVVCEFYNIDGNYSIDDIIVNARFQPTWILTNHTKNNARFCFLYFIESRDLDLDRYSGIALTLRDSFNEYEVDRTRIEIGEEYVNQYKVKYTNEQYFYKLLNFSQQQLDDVYNIFEERW